ncbi:NAD(P)H-dependent oxidoreductase [Clostridium bowmanii]|uniref:flavodoxin family protein n=1 Tax=Clostridium bowmanii TaxID=132925 RepID=UPI001C0D1965|nr:NAD(P)H-dependent oxidoreductase [Clostridium bowmanii]MBU3189792.1 NAD(P)H-dependent oxidoreductase [Clostridium bowmanii]MCA1074275.1 NAD(P)H-dependent oxidoreductase [Clostridium bowmanii]
MKDIFVIAPSKNISPMLSDMISKVTRYTNYTLVENSNNIPNLQNKKIFFASESTDINCDISMLHFFSKLYEKGTKCLLGSVGAILVHSSTDHGTKRTSQDIIYLANNLGCSFIGHSVVEATSSLRNFITRQKNLNLPLEEICLIMCSRLRNRLLEYNPITINNPKILVLYSSPHKTSNTLDLWHMTSQHLSLCDIKELQIENGDVLDCKGCSYTLCTHYGTQNKCFYGGVMVDDVLPSIEKSDAIIWLCPNYNDAIASNLTAVINRLTVLYRRMSFYDKTIFSVVVSGNSGSDSISKQLIGALNVNKGFRLPPYFSIMAIANDPGEIFNIPQIHELAKDFADNIKKEIKA